MLLMVLLECLLTGHFYTSAENIQVSRKIQTPLVKQKVVQKVVAMIQKPVRVMMLQTQVMLKRAQCIMRQARTYLKTPHKFKSRERKHTC
ncbi:hypothetical protein KC19_4G093900 [Ceratodon purpureus]|uniref:Secreted protein n=1 Tax=Ceratodon purpureus TaxID=3225 RepID=A0A8T0I8R5_CERPU|nr:hypothetical protein KC19_4G093900 [Ceratodon purpureus]